MLRLGISVSILLGFILLSGATLLKKNDFETCISHLSKNFETNAGEPDNAKNAAKRQFILGRMCAGSAVSN